MIATKIRKIKIGKTGRDIRKISLGDILIFSDGRRETIEESDYLAGKVYTQRDNVSKEKPTIEKICYALPSPGEKIFPTSFGRVYNWEYKL